MRDELILRKNNGENFAQRHFNAWANLDNWNIEPDNDRKEQENPW